MSDEQTTRTDAEKTTGTAKTVPPTPPVASEAPAGEAASSPTTSATSTGASTTPSTDASTSSSTSGATGAAGAAAGSPFDKAVDAATEAAKKATARLKEAADNADLDHFADEAKRVTGTWSQKVKAEYERRPGVVIGAAVAGAVVLGAIARAIGRRR